MSAMRLQTIIIPGWRNSDAGHWQSLWESRLSNVVRLQQEDWDTPSPAAWVDTLARAISESPTPALLVAHSLGCVTVAHLPASLQRRVAGALLVAPADIERPGAHEALRSFGPIPLNPLPFQSVVVASDNDPYCALDRARLFADAWGSRLNILSEAGHINSASGFGAWPQGLKILTALRRRASWRLVPPAPRIPPVPERTVRT
ncbi:hypothetical protein EV679_1898 [Kerstersia gyiorum]|uniref:Alpha/beta hydrolase n=2 Tax=Kerstersia gyiorum TaxID=206506 RepID=A0A4Q7MRR8_9BURK|nr:hypothetical protein EV679_1898 [Kerstersia gyiorum]